MDPNQLVEPGNRAPAPGRLRIVQAFVNTTDRIISLDELSSPDKLQEWLAAWELVDDAELDERDLARALELREALRELLVANAEHGRVHEDALEGLNRAGVEGRLVVRFDRDGVGSLDASTPGLAGALGRLVAIAYTAMADGTWERLKACRSAECRWAFYDSSRNRSGAWCTMSVCGSRAKSRAYRRRRKDG
jgi:predicted RNA-binding Zn ribbon-like protein